MNRVNGPVGIGEGIAKGKFDVRWGEGRSKKKQERIIKRAILTLCRVKLSGFSSIRYFWKDFSLPLQEAI